MQSRETPFVVVSFEMDITFILMEHYFKSDFTDD